MLKDGKATEEEIDDNENKSLEFIAEEFQRGFDFIKKYGRSVTFFGSARFDQENEHCVKARSLAKHISELGYTIVTGGGPGIMEAANHGAVDAGGNSLGISIKLTKEQVTNPYVKDGIALSYFFVRKTMLTFAAEAFVFSPGGFGTLDEFFDILTLVQTGKIPVVPIILFGRDYWEPLDVFIKEHLLKKHNSVSPNEIRLYTITDDEEEIIGLIKKAPTQNWWKEFLE